MKFLILELFYFIPISTAAGFGWISYNFSYQFFLMFSKIL